MLFAAHASSPQNLSIFDAASSAAQSIADLAVLALAITGLIFVVVEGVLFFSIWRFRQRASDITAESPQVYGSHAVEIAWTAAPTLVVVFLVLVTARTLWELNVHAPSAPSSDEATLVVTVVGRQWWWEYVYESYNGRPLGFATANELHIPVSEAGTPRPVRLILKSGDVCHSFWVPRLAGKVDLIPGRVNSLVLQTEKAGLYLGQCAEYCGVQHAGMLIRVVAQPPDEFERWLDRQQMPAVDDPLARDGKQVFLSQSCVSCHRVRGTSADGNYAPDLTHLMSRQTLASGLIENTEENLDRWLRDPHSIKPGCLMPAFKLSNDQRALVVRYLRTLR